MITTTVANLNRTLQNLPCDAGIQILSTHGEIRMAEEANDLRASVSLAGTSSADVTAGAQGPLLKRLVKTLASGEVTLAAGTLRHYCGSDIAPLQISSGRFRATLEPGTDSVYTPHDGGLEHSWTCDVAILANGLAACTRHLASDGYHDTLEIGDGGIIAADDTWLVCLSIPALYGPPVALDIAGGKALASTLRAAQPGTPATVSVTSTSVTVTVGQCAWTIRRVPYPRHKGLLALARERGFLAFVTVWRAEIDGKIARRWLRTADEETSVSLRTSPHGVDLAQGNNCRQVGMIGAPGLNIAGNARHFSIILPAMDSVWIHGSSLTGGLVSTTDDAGVVRVIRSVDPADTAPADDAVA